VGRLTIYTEEAIKNLGEKKKWILNQSLQKRQLWK
jgi:hypothetical protein